MLAKDLEQPNHINTWCPGCGNFSILFAVKKAIMELNLNPKNIVCISGIGCGSKLPHYLKVYGFEGLHGRVLPLATGIKLANPNLNVIAFAGDGDAYSIGSAHFLHALRRNLNLCYIIHNNGIYALTKSQYSPTTEKGYVGPTTPHGSIEIPFNPLAVAIAGGATFVARASAGDIPKLTEILKQGIQHKGLAIIDILQPCVTWRKEKAFDFLKERVYSVDQFRSKTDAIKFLLEEDIYGKKIATGIFYVEQRPSYEDELKITDKTPIVKQDIKKVDISKLLNNLE